MQIGLVIKSFCGYVQVLDKNDLYLAKPRGTLDINDIYAGDYVNFTPTDKDQAVIEEVLPRKNVLQHPQSANLDQVIIVVSREAPEISWETIDKFICLARQTKITPVICFNKIDLYPEQLAEIKSIYSAKFFETVFVSAKSGENLNLLKELLQNKVSILAGPSGTGKSSLINKLNSELHLKVQDVSQKNSHGRHTTRFAEVLLLDQQTKVIDSPGFSNLDLSMEPAELVNSFPEIEQAAEHCRFKGCLHDQEPDCAVKAAVNKNIANSRYTAYIKFLHDLQEKDKNKYKRQYKESFRKGSSKKWKKS